MVEEAYQEASTACQASRGLAPGGRVDAMTLAALLGAGTAPGPQPDDGGAPDIPIPLIVGLGVAAAVLVGMRR